MSAFFESLDKDSDRVMPERLTKYNWVKSVKGRRVCRICGKDKRASDFRFRRLTCRKCCYVKGRVKVVAWKNGRKEYCNSQYSGWRLKHPLSRKLSVIRQHGVKVAGLLIILEKMYAQSPFCEYCNIALNVDDVSLDHKIPVSRGGLPADPGNWAICCKDCNYLKQARTPDEFKAFLNSYLKRFSANTEPSHVFMEGVTVSPGIMDISAQAHG